jgi:hypothetical protein
VTVTLPLSDHHTMRAWSYMRDTRGRIVNPWTLEDPSQPMDEPPLCECECCWEDDCQCEDCPGPMEPDYATMVLDR